MNVTKATVIHNEYGADGVVLHVDDMPSPMPHVTKENLDLMFYAQAGTGEDYVKANFPGIPIVIVPAV